MGELRGGVSDFGGGLGDLLQAVERGEHSVP